jgi:anaphase-promoting complex subunit 2
MFVDDGGSIAELFDIIVEWPDSMPALEDLRVCMQRVSLLRELVTELRATCARHSFVSPRVG